MTKGINVTLEDLWQQYVTTDLWDGISDIELFNARNAYFTGAAAFSAVQSTVLEIEDETERYNALLKLANEITRGLVKQNREYGSVTSPTDKAKFEQFLEFMTIHFTSYEDVLNIKIKDGDLQVNFYEDGSYQNMYVI